MAHDTPTITAQPRERTGTRAGDAAEFRELVDAETVLLPELAKQFREVD